MSKTTKSGAPAPRPTPKVPVSQPAVSRVQSAVAKKHAGGVPKDTYVGRMQRTLAKTTAN